MCCSVSPAVEVKFSDTILYAAEIVNSYNQIVHALGYQNRAQNNVNGSAQWWSKLKNSFTESSGNAMLLPFPCLPRTMSSANVLETKDCPHILKNMAQALQPPPRPTFAVSQSLDRSRAAVEIFEAAGIYTVVL